MAHILFGKPAPTPEQVRGQAFSGICARQRSLSSTIRMETFRASRVDIVSNRVQPREIDGDVIEPGRRLRAVIRPKALHLCVPPA